MIRLKGKVATAEPVDVVNYLNRVKFTVLFSGGKDSLATLLWVLENVKHDNWNIIYAEVTGNTSSLCTDYVKEVCKCLGVYNKLIIVKREDLTFWDAMCRWGIPLLSGRRWCLHEFKHKLFKRYAHFVCVTGLRNEESPQRRRMSVIDYYRRSQQINVNPVIAWTRQQVADYIKRYDIPVNPCYQIYGHSGNCMFCPYHTKAQIIKTLADPRWRSIILPALHNAKAKGKLQQQIKRKWLSLAKQNTLY